MISRQDAKTAGLKRYYAGIPCKYGHDCERLVSNCHCLMCSAIGVAEWKSKHRDKHLKYHKQYDKTRTGVAAKTRARRDRNRDKFNESRREYYSRNKRRIQTNMRNSEKRHIEKHRARVNAKKRNRNALKRAAEGTHSPKDVSSILQQQRGKCAYCRVKVGNKYHVDHIVALSKGGSNWPKNLQILCGPCNLDKSSHDPLAYAQKLGRLL